MIYRREEPKTPSKRFKSVILNPIGVKIRNKFAYINKKQNTARAFGKKVCLRRKTSVYKTQLNLTHGVNQQLYFIVKDISLSRRYKTFAGIIIFSNGALYSIPMYSGALPGNLHKVCIYLTSPKVIFLSYFNTGNIIPAAYLRINHCFFNILLSYSTTS